MKDYHFVQEDPSTLRKNSKNHSNSGEGWKKEPSKIEAGALMNLEGPLANVYRKKYKSELKKSGESMADCNCKETASSHILKGKIAIKRSNRSSTIPDIHHRKVVSAVSKNPLPKIETYLARLRKRESLRKESAFTISHDAVDKQVATFPP
ncbi:hypothetical protein HK103_000712 [Boothiomyces macroporosus]|uniref:Uncharacterized protein n=1 Tax=Boothiomyces macroporosus TaxID=261099 RepID=A0AAD5UF22_9FUNG|nr:hypothetical protein HK103_000712 [Boothiomyces macroporosus]